jgi:hypothetical protein
VEFETVFGNQWLKSSRLSVCDYDNNKYLLLSRESQFFSDFFWPKRRVHQKVVVSKGAEMTANRFVLFEEMETHSYRVLATDEQSFGTV